MREIDLVDRRADFEEDFALRKLDFLEMRPQRGGVRSRQRSNNELANGLRDFAMGSCLARRERDSVSQPLTPERVVSVMS